MKGRRSQRTYAFRSGSERWAFVPHPEVAGWWFRLHPAVLVAACPFPHCGAVPGAPCKNKNGYVNFLHWDRRMAAKEGVAKLDFAVGVVVELGRTRG